MICCTLGLVGAVGTSFDDKGALVVFWDCHEAAPPPQTLRAAAESLRCLGRPAEVMGPFSYPCGRSTLLLGKASFERWQGCFWYLQGDGLGHGAIWALRVPCKLAPT